ncbi:MAG: 2-oxoacid:acceptor oxidoreductase subunit alpha, partial [Bacteroidia bacterium]
ALYGRNGECPVPVVAACSPSDCFDTVFEATRIAVEHLTPVFFLSDGYIANGAEPWAFPQTADLPKIQVQFAANTLAEGEKFLPYKRNEKLARAWAIPGTAGLEHRIGGIEKEHETGNISYDPDNHEFMVKLRAARVAKIAEYIPEQKLDSGPDAGKVLVVGWGSTYGAIKTALIELREMGLDASHAHIRYLNPFPKNLGDLLKKFDRVLVPEMNNGQLVKILRDQFLIDAIAMNKIKGIPFTATELKNRIAELLK